MKGLTAEKPVKILGSLGLYGLSALLITLSGAACKGTPDGHPLHRLHPAGFTAVDSPEVYDKESLFAYMNGEAETYFPFGFELLLVRVYHGQGMKAQMFVEAYDMGTPQGAQGLFRVYTQRQGSPVKGLGDIAWTDKSRVALFCRGRYFFRVIPDPAQDAAEEAAPGDLLQLCRALDRALEPAPGKK